jgi:hypothetical protein
VVQVLGHGGCSPTPVKEAPLSHDAPPVDLLPSCHLLLCPLLPLLERVRGPRFSSDLRPATALPITTLVRRIRSVLTTPLFSPADCIPDTPPSTANSSASASSSIPRSLREYCNSSPAARSVSS